MFLEKTKILTENKVKVTLFKLTLDKVARFITIKLAYSFCVEHGN